MKITLSRMIVPVPLILGLGLTACTVMTKEEHVEMPSSDFPTTYPPVLIANM